MDKEISFHDLEYLVSNQDIYNKLKGYPIKVLTYKQLKSYNNLETLIPHDKSAIFILIRTNEQSGHWTVLVRYNNTIYVFDSYGVGIDGELSHVSSNLKYELGEDKHYLSELIAKSHYNLKTNHFQYQSHDNQINTCGRW